MIRVAAIVVVLALAPALLAQDNPAAKTPPETPAVTKPAQPQPAAQPAGDKAYVQLETSLGNILLELDTEKAPITVKNFLDYVDSGFYNGLIFHRVMRTFMIQGGGFTPELDKKTATQPPIKNEWQNGLKNVRGTIAMARMGGQADSATSEFFINVVDNAMLDMPRDGSGYAVFGKVVAGLDTVDKIRNVEVVTHPKLSMGQVVPKETVLIKSARRVPAADAQAAIAQAREAEVKAQAEKKSAAEKSVTDYVAALEKETGKKVQTTASGLKYVIVQDGIGPSPGPTDSVEVHYTGTLLDGTKFDSSRDRGQPFSFSLRGGVIKGWLEGVASMKVGEHRTLIIPPDLGYGASGSPPKIPPNAWLAFDIELLSIKPQ